MNRLKLVMVTGLLVGVISGCSKTGDPVPSPSAEPPRLSSETLVTVTAEPIEVVAGDRGEAVVKLNTQSGYHINANPASFDYLKATEVDLPDTPQVAVDYIYYPNPQVKKFSFSDQALRVYEGETELKIMLSAEKAATKGAHNIPAKLNVQACDDKLCYPPGSISFSIPVTIK